MWKIPPEWWCEKGKENDRLTAAGQPVKWEYGSLIPSKMTREFTVFNCSQAGVAGTTKVFVRKVGDKFVARVGIVILGSTNMKEGELAVSNPFDPDFEDNYAEGIGVTQEAAIEDMKKDMGDIAESIWL